MGVDIPRKIVLYNQSREKVDFKKLKEFVWGNFALKLEIRQNFPANKLSIKDLTLEFAKSRVRDINNPLAKHSPLPLEIANEEHYLKNNKVNPNLIYDALKLLLLFEKLLKVEDPGNCQIVLTDRLLGTFADDSRFHLRSIVCGYPSIISISGIVEAPARPKEFYLIKNRLVLLGLWEQEEDNVRARFKSRFIDFGDKRITEVLKGFISQALFFYFAKNPFCEERACRLFNSHWQEDLIYSQVKTGRFCKKHARSVKNLLIQERMEK